MRLGDDEKDYYVRTPQVGNPAEAVGVAGRAGDTVEEKV
jgi:hypothetical protein